MNDYGRRVKPEGKTTAKFVLVGEAPGRTEAERGRPFIGPAGGKLRSFLERVGIQRSDCWIDNTFPYRPNEKNDLSLVPEEDRVPHIGELHQRIAALKEPAIIVPMGNYALEAILEKSSITKHRGSIYEYVDLNGRKIKVIPTLHPAALFKQPKWEKRCRLDWQRIADDATFPHDLRLPEREHFIRPTLDDVRWYVAEAKAKAQRLSIDIETAPTRWPEVVGYTKAGKEKIKWMKGRPRCMMVGLSFDPRFSMTIDTTLEYWQSKKRLAEAWALLQELLESPVEKIFQNGHYDNFYFVRERGIWVRNWRWDTRWLHHCLDVNDDHSLEYMASICTREPYWKDESKDSEDTDKFRKNMDCWRTYNGKDSCVPLELHEQFVAGLERAGRLGEYLTQYQRHFRQFLQMMTEGVRVDRRLAGIRWASLTAKCVTIQDELTRIAGEPLYGKVDLSGTKLTRFLYETRGLPKQYAKNSKGVRAVSTKEVIVRRLMLRYPHKIGEKAQGGDGSGPLILDHRRSYKLKSFYDVEAIDPDDRMRCQYGFTPETGRTSSSSNPQGTGMNLQNTDRECRDIFLPDEGHVFLEFDASQGESRIVDVLAYNATKEDWILERARAHPADVDGHTINASKIFGVTPENVTKAQRYLGKRAKHAGNYGMRGTKLSEELLKDGFVYTPEECQRFIDAGLDAPIQHWQRRTRQEVIRNRFLKDTVWGGQIDFTYDRPGDDLFRRAFAWRPQRYLAKLVNEWAFYPLGKYLKARGMAARIRLHVHDSLVVSTPIDELYEIMEFVRATLERPVSYDGTELLIPVTWTVGTRYGDNKKGKPEHHVEWKRFPSEEDVVETARRLLGAVKVAA